MTHSWTEDMSPVWTAVNQYQWPVPLPRRVSLEYLRAELLSLGAEYIWIDVICLQQNTKVDVSNYGGTRVDALEEMRQEEIEIRCTYD